MVNAENILKVADAIEGKSIPGLGFHMNYLVGNEADDAEDDKLNVANCNTVACIAGWANALNANLPNATFGFARSFLGLDEAQGDQLFYASNHPDAEDGMGPLDYIEPFRAVRTLRHLAATGEVDWTV